MGMDQTPIQKRRIVLTFPKETVNQPITYHLIKDYDLMINILRAKVSPEEEGKLVIELSGRVRDIKKAITYLKDLGVSIQPLAQDIKWLEDRCTHCTACISICPSGALSVDRKEMFVSFDSEKCILCTLCIPACPFKAIEILL